MRLNDITVNRVGVLHDIRLADIPELSVIYGGNGSGKSTLVRFVMETLLEAGTAGADVTSDSPLGTITVTDKHHRWDVTRYQSHNGRLHSRVSWHDHSSWTGSLRAHFPSWVTEEVFREIFCPGYAEADRFDLLFRLCLESGGAVIDDTEVHRTEQAIRLALEERDGTHSVPGIDQQIADLERQRDELRRELAGLKRHDPSIPREIAAIEARIARFTERNREIDRETAQLRERITDLEQRIVRLQRRNVLPLDAERIHAELSDLIARRDRWTAIRTSIDREIGHIGEHSPLSPARSRRSVRAVVDRIEERLHQNHSGQPPWNDHLGRELSALCHFVNQQQDAAALHEQLLESELSHRAVECIRRVEVHLQARIDAATEEMSRAKNVLDGKIHQGMRSCGASWHHRMDSSEGLESDTLESLKAEIHGLQERLRSLQSEQEHNTDEILQLSRQLEDLRRKLTGFVSLEHIDQLQSRIAELEARIDRHRRQYELLTRTEADLRQVLARLRERRHPGVLEVATPWIHRLTEGECTEFVAGSRHQQLLVATRTSTTPLRIDQLSRGTQHQVALVLRLALLKVRSSDAVRMPLIIDDVFVTSDDNRGALAADLLKSVASGGQQILLLTCQNDVRGLMAARGAGTYHLSDAPVELQNPAPVRSAIPARAILTQPDIVETDDSWDDDTDTESVWNSVTEDDSHWLFYLEPDHPISDLSGLEISELNALQGVRIATVDDLISVPAVELERTMNDAGYHMTRDRVCELQAQASMVICVPMLRQRDAELLIAAGINNVRQLSRLRPEAIHELVVRFQNSDKGSRYVRSGHTIDQQQAISWNRWALHARTLDRARSQGSGNRQHRGTRSPRSGFSPSSGRGVRDRRNRIRTGGVPATRRTVRAKVSENGRRRRENRILRRRQQLTSDQTTLTTAGNGTTEKQAELRFYLSRSSNVEAAPSIGAKTASRLAKIGIISVDDLLKCDPETVVTLLDNRRITVDVIRQWQNQARLVCTIPQLRGHDAQILVACGLTDPNAISSLSPEKLYAAVKPFCDTSEGERIVRGGKKPDVKEIKDWISWARQSRPLRVA